MRRREFIRLFGSAVTGWPLAARAQQAARMRRIGVYMNLAADDPEGQARLAAFLQGLQEAGWAVGNRGKSRGNQAVAQRCLTIAGKYGTSGWFGTASREPR
jgi:DNA-binding LacI/PurR family transcriptional regulator